MSDGLGADVRRSPGYDARFLVRSALKASLATIDRASGYPYVSLVTVATTVTGRPLLLLSKLALHTQNLDADPRASLLFDATGADADPLAGGRVTLTGTLERTTDPAVRDRFVRRQPAAAGYAGFADFGFFAMAVERAHFVGGFGRIVTLPASEVILDIVDLERFSSDEPAAVERLNRDPQAVSAVASSLGAAATDGWTLSGLDPEGFDLVGNGQALRAWFSRPLQNAASFTLAGPSALR